jgi:hypothetical protein
MRRRIIIAVYLGVLTTVASAWFLALAPTQRRWSMSGMPIDPPPLSATTRQLTIEHERGPGDEWVQLVVVKMQRGVLADGTPSLEVAGAYASLGPTFAADPPWRLDASTARAVRAAINDFPHPPWPSWLPAIPPTGAGLVSYGARATGWPLKSMRSLSRLEEPGGALRWSGSLRLRPLSAYRPQDARGPQKGCVPILPVPLGFTLDTAVFGALWAVPLIVMPALRARRRARRGRCPACGYDLRAGAHERCPECGVAG